MLQACVIGVGNMGRHHARIYFENNQVQLRGISDSNTEVGRKYADKYDIDFFTNYNKMLDTIKPDLVSLVTPTSTHYEIGKEILNRGINLLIEKPIADSIKHGEKLIQISEENDLVLLVGHIERYNPGIKAIKKVIDKNFFGRISSMQFQRVGVVPPQIKDTNVVIDLAIHDIDLSNYLIGDTPDNYKANLNNTHLKNRYDSCDILISYPNSSSYIQANWITPVKIRTLTITGEKGYARLNLVTQKLELFESIIETDFDDYGEYIILFKKPAITSFNVEKEEPLGLEINNFINTIKKKEKLKINPREALVSLDIAIDINNSNKC